MSKDLTIVEPKRGQYLIEDAFKLIGFGRTQYKVTLVCGIGSFTLYNQLLGWMLIMSASQCDLELSTEDKGFLNSATYLGFMVPAYMWGYLSDTRGRRTILLFSFKSLIVSAIVSSFAPTLLFMWFCRFFTGCFMAGIFSCFYAYMSECTTVEKGSVLLAWVTLIGSTGYLYAPITSWILLSMDFSWSIFGLFEYRPWRLILILLVIPECIAVLILSTLPESPKFLLSRGNPKEALKTIQQIFEENTKNPASALPIHELLPEPDDALFRFEKEEGFLGIVKTIVGQIVPLFKPPFVVNFTILAYIQVAVYSVGPGMMMWFADIQNQLSNSNQTGTVCEILNSVDKTNQTDIEECNDTIKYETFMNTLILGMCAIATLLIISLFIKSLGRGTILFLWLLGSALCGISLQFITNETMLIIAYSVFLTSAVTAIPVSNGSGVILFPTTIRGTVISLIGMFGRLSSSITNIIIGYTIDSYCKYTFGGITLLIAVATGLTLLLPMKKLNQ